MFNIKSLSGVVCVSLGILSAIALGQAILAWTNPSLNPSGGGGAISSLNGVVSINQLKITGGTPGTGKVLTSDASGLVSWQAPASGSQATLDVTPIPAGTTGTYTPDYNALKICQFGTCCPPWKDCDGDTKTYQAGNDCNEGCATCYVGSIAGSASPDGKDQDCDGIVDESMPLRILSVAYETSCAVKCQLGNFGAACISVGCNAGASDGSKRNLVNEDTCANSSCGSVGTITCGTTGASQCSLGSWTSSCNCGSGYQ